MSVLIFSLNGMITQVPACSSVPVSFLESAISKGAVCLDGTAPAYAYVEGSGDGAHSWIVYLEGGAWCNNLTDCYDRSHSKLGSSNTLRGTQIGFSSMLDFNCTSDPDFCHWHKLYFHYCDGSSFMSDVMGTKANLSFRGARIFDIMMEEMLSKGMGNAKPAILSGSSAGGLAAMLNCNKFHKLFPGRTEVKCISDSGFFLHGTRKLGLPVSGVPNLADLKITDCRGIEEIFEDEGRDSITLPKFISLTLYGLPRLKFVCKATMICNSYRFISIFECPKLTKKLPLQSESDAPPPASNRDIRVEREWWESLEWDFNPSLPQLLQPFVRFRD